MTIETTQLQERLTAFAQVEVCRQTDNILSLLLIGTELSRMEYINCINTIIIEEIGEGWHVHSYRNTDTYLFIVLTMKEVSS